MAYGKLFIESYMMCAGSIDGRNGACQGDSGSPFTYDGMVLGLVSFGFGCTDPGYMSIYMIVAAYREWIDGHLE